MNELISLEADKSLQLYNKMCAAINRCSSVDECKDIVDKSVAIAAYYKQIKDEDTTLKFYRVRLRAWRRIAELLSTVDTSRCSTQDSKTRKIKAAFGEVVSDMTGSRIIELLKLSTISDADFEHAISNQKISGSVANLFQFTPQHEEQVRKNQELRDKPRPPPTAKEIAEEKAEEAERKAWLEAEQQKTGIALSLRKPLPPPCRKLV